MGVELVPAVEWLSRSQNLVLRCAENQSVMANQSPCASLEGSESHKGSFNHQNRN